MASPDVVTLRACSVSGVMRVEHWRAGHAACATAVILHGRNGAADQRHMVPLRAATVRAGLETVVPNLPCSAANASAGDASAFTMAGHLADSRAVVRWAAAQTSRPLLLVGHSMGAYAACRLATERSARTAALMALSPVVSGAALLARRSRSGRSALRREVPMAEREWPDHDLADIVDRLAMPSAVIVGADDTITPPAEAQSLADAMPGCRAYLCLPGEHHCPVGPGYAAKVADILEDLLAAAGLKTSSAPHAT